MADAENLSQDDLAFLAARGISKEEAERQLQVLRSPPPFMILDRPCTPGDGIERFTEEDEPRLLAAHRAAAAAGRLSLFIPASGAATRMFKDLLSHTSGAPPSAPVRAFLDGLKRFAFHDLLADALGAAPEASAPERVLDVLLKDEGLGFAGLPKGLIPFHHVDGAARTPLEEHLLEAVALVADARGVCRLHFTVSPEHQRRFEELVRAAASPTHQVAFSTQKPATDTLAVDGNGAIFRTSEGEPLLRPAGHGALLANLDDLDADLVLVKNIDNVAAAGWREPSVRHGQLLLGRLAELDDAVRAALSQLAAGEGTAAAARLAREELGLSVPDERQALVAALDRPLRVCGMVPNTGEPGGGPFWVRDAGGHVSRQIVESSQVGPSQKAILAAATHFNPVLLACALRDHRGAPHALDRHVDPAAAIVTRKSSGGRELVALERPGLWNGAMAGWNTVFVEVPVSVFNPVKTVNDLLRREHQPA